MFDPTRSHVFLLLLAGGVVFTTGSAAERPAPPTTITLPEIGRSSASQFTPAQLAFVQSWIRQQAPECPLDLCEVVAQSFLEELSVTQPEKYDQLLAADFPARRLDSLLLRLVGAKLTKPAQAEAREKIASRRLIALLVREGLPAAGVAAQLQGLRDDSSYQYRRLLEGRIEDDDLIALLRKEGPAGEKASAVAKNKAAAPKVQTAAEIVSEFSRHNQTGAAVQRLQAFVIEGRLTSITGEVQQVIISKMRPDYVRIVMLEGGQARYYLGAEGDRFWQQVPGQPPQFAAAQAMGARRFITEFTDPLFVSDGYSFERLPDGGEGGKPFHRIGVRRPDGSGYVSRIEPGTFRQIGRENPDQSIARYSDFREIAGVTFAFREEITDAQGRKGVLELTRLRPNPGLIEAYFRPPAEPGLDYHQVEQFLGRPPLTAARLTSSP